DGIVRPYIDANLDVTALLRAIFLRPEFYSARAYNQLVRSPIEYVVAAMKGVGYGPDVAHPEWYLDGMGQRPFYPPNVAGWKQNAYWISSSAQWAKSSFA